MWNKKEDKTVLGQGLIKGLKEAVEAEVISNPHTGSSFDDFLQSEGIEDEVTTKVSQREALVQITQDGELFELLETSNQLVEQLAKALNDSLGFLPAGGSVRSTVDKALAKYNASKNA